MNMRKIPYVISVLMVLLAAGCSGKMYRKSTFLSVDAVNVDDMTFTGHESSPQFPGGDRAMLEYVYDNLQYPKEAYDKNIQGRVVGGIS